MKLRNYLILFSLAVSCTLSAQHRETINLKDYGVCPGTPNLAKRINDALEQIKAKNHEGKSLVIRFEKGVYELHEKDAVEREYYVSNHDQDQPKRIGIDLDGWNNLTLDGKGAEFVCCGRMIPLALGNSSDCTIKNMSFDFKEPHIVQAEILENSQEKGTTFRLAPWVNYRIADNGRLQTYGEGWSAEQSTGIAFEKATGHVVYRTSDLHIPTDGVKELEDHTLIAPNWKDKRLIEGTVVAMRTYYRPTPGIFLYENKNTALKNVTVHYAEGMGLIAQRCDGITLKKFNVCIKKGSGRYFTTQADATHFSQCKGHIKSTHGLYEAMMDDAINIHGVYLKAQRRIDERTLVCSFEHYQAYGFPWGDKGDSVIFVRSDAMQTLGEPNIIASIEPENGSLKGTKRFVIKFEQPIPEGIGSDGKKYGIENLTWTPTVEFSHNIVRNNRARGALFSSPRKTVCANNVFDHTSGTAILLCGDCNGWYESGACRDLLIRKNKFINALTNLFQFTNAVISIYPEIPSLDKQTEAFHGGSPRAIRIEDNLFKTFDAPLLYAKSVDGLTFTGNKVIKTDDYARFHWNQKPV